MDKSGIIHTAAYEHAVALKSVRDSQNLHRGSCNALENQACASTAWECEHLRIDVSEGARGPRPEQSWAAHLQSQRQRGQARLLERHDEDAMCLEKKEESEDYEAIKYRHPSYGVGVTLACEMWRALVSVHLRWASASTASS